MTDAEHYDIEKIIIKKKGGKYHYLIKKKNIPKNECRWKPIDNFEKIKKIVDELNPKCKEKQTKIKTNKDNKEKEKEKDNIKKDDKPFLNHKRKNSESTEEDIKEINEESVISEPFIKAKESSEKIISVSLEKHDLIALVEKKENNGNIITEKINTKELKKKNPWILINYYESNIIFC